MNEIIEKEKVEDLIYEIRGKQVMLDSDLAKLYKVETKRINEAVKNNPEKFPERFSWKLTDKESNIFLVENFDQKLETRGGKYKNQRVFTEQGVMMLATILKTKIAIETTIRIMDAFVEMKKYFSNNLLEQKFINNQVIKNTKEIEINSEKIKLLQESFDKLSKKRKASEIYFNGQMFDAYSRIISIFSEATEELIIVDMYADIKILDIIKELNIKVTIITKKNNLLKENDIEIYNKQYNNLKVIYNNTFHDRYFIIDNKTVYHCGTSINRIGYKTFSINLLNDKDVTIPLINNMNSIKQKH
ncbi:MAG: ORF6N domain-containing protein [Bacilli bacterium]